MTSMLSPFPILTSGNSNVPLTSSPSYTMRRTSSDDETRRGDNRPTLPPIRDLFGSKLPFIPTSALY